MAGAAAAGLAGVQAGVLAGGGHDGILRRRGPDNADGLVDRYGRIVVRYFGVSRRVGSNEFRSQKRLRKSVQGCIVVIGPSDRLEIRPEMEEGDQTPTELRALSAEANDARRRKRFPALHVSADKRTNACAWAREIGRPGETVLKWVHDCRRTALGISRHCGRKGADREPSLRVA